MTYSEAIDYLYAQLPVFHRVGAKAIKTGLTNTLQFCAYLGNPQERFASVHVGGTNGKGSSSHLLASVLQSAGYKTGLYTSPHLKSFTERIRVNGFPLPDEEVASFVVKHRAFIEDLKPSFFEVTVAMAFDHFARQNVDVAVIEVGLGGRLDSTNVISPLVSLITNIGWDHADVLGNSLEEIAREKGGIIKPATPIVISERDPATQAVFVELAEQRQSPIVFASDCYTIKDLGVHDNGRTIAVTDQNNTLTSLVVGLMGTYQLKNTAGVLAVLNLLKNRFEIPESAIQTGFEQVVERTGLKGRWQTLQHNPTVICDTAHNEPGIRTVLESLRTVPYQHLYLVVGFVKDKDLSKVITLFPKEATYYFCEPDIPRALDAESLAKAFREHGYDGEVVNDVNQALDAALRHAQPTDCILVTGSTYVIAELNQLEA